MPKIIGDAEIVPGDAFVADAKLVPGAELIRAFVDQLRAKMQEDEQLRTRFNEDPRAILSEFGIVVDLQKEIMREQGGFPEIAVTEDDWCISTGSCCCETL